MSWNICQTAYQTHVCCFTSCNIVFFSSKISYFNLSKYFAKIALTERETPAMLSIAILNNELDLLTITSSRGYPQRGSIDE